MAQMLQVYAKIHPSIHPHPLFSGTVWHLKKKYLPTGFKCENMISCVSWYYIQMPEGEGYLWETFTWMNKWSPAAAVVSHVRESKRPLAATNIENLNWKQPFIMWCDHFSIEVSLSAFEGGSPLILIQVKPGWFQTGHERIWWFRCKRNV